MESLIYTFCLGVAVCTLLLHLSFSVSVCGRVCLFISLTLALSLTLLITQGYRVTGNLELVQSSVVKLPEATPIS